MSRLDLLAARVRGEFREMPGMRLTFAQACRLWGLDAPTCDVILLALVAEGFLWRTADGMFMALPSAAASPRPKVTESPHRRSA